MIAHEQLFWKLFFFRDWLFQPLIIFRNKQIQKNWIDEWSQSIYAVSSNKWTNNKIEFVWLKKIFYFQIVDLKNRRFFLIDNHKSHVFVRFIEYCCAIDIIFLCFSFHTIHYFQSLNVDCFESLVKTYKKQLNDKNQLKIVQITKLDFLIYLRRTKTEIITTENIITI